MYIPTDGKTHIHFELDANHLKPYLGFGLNGTATINWGDGSAEEIITGNNVRTVLFTQHEYLLPGLKEITIAISNDGRLRIQKYSNVFSLLTGSDKTQSSVYKSFLIAVELSTGVELDNAFTGCDNLKTITMPMEMVFDLFTDCTSL